MIDFRPSFRILRFWLMGRWQYATLLEVLEFPFPRRFGDDRRDRIEHIEQAGEHLVVWIKGISRPLYYPKDIEMRSLHVTINDCMNPKSWHYYETAGTTVERDDVVLDCGASEGLFSLLALGRCKEVFIAEPLPEFVDCLNLTFSGIQHVKVLPFALSEQSGEAFLESAGTSSRIVSRSVGIKITTRSIDSLFAANGEDVTYIKADLEGHETEVLKGATRTIQRNAPKIAITTYHNPEHAEWIQRFLTKIEPRYTIKKRGICLEQGNPVMLHAWIE